MNKNYFKYLVKSNRFIFYVLLLGMIMINLVSDFESRFLLLEIAVVLLSIVAPIYFLSYIHKKEEVSVFNSFPITKKELFKTKFYYSNYLILSLILISIFLNLFFTLVFGIKGGILSIISFLLISMILLIIMNSINQIICMFILERCNNMFDSILSIAAYSILPFITMNSIQNFIGMNSLTLDNIFIYIPRNVLSPFGFVLEMIGSITRGTPNSGQLLDVSIINLMIFSLGAWILISIFLYRKTMKAIVKHETEQAGQKSTSPLITVIPVVWITTLFLLTLIVGSHSNLIASVFVIVLYFGGLSVYQRKLVVTKKSVVLLCAIFVSLNLFKFVFNKTNALGLEELLLQTRELMEVRIEKSYNDDFYNQEVWLVNTVDEEIEHLFKKMMKEHINDYYESDNRYYYSHMNNQVKLQGAYENPYSRTSISLSDKDYQEFTILLKEKGYEKEIIDRRYE